MRNDLTIAFREKMGAPWRKPIQLLVFHFSIAGDIYLSDRDITVGDTQYIRGVENWGDLEDSIDNKLETGETTQVTLSLLDTNTPKFSEYFEQDDPENVEVDYYQWFDGLDESDVALIDTFVIQSPIKADESDKRVTIDLVSANIKYDGKIGDVVTLDAYKHALPADVGKGIDLVVGSPGQIKTLCVVTGSKATLLGSIMSGSLIIEAKEDILEAGFAPKGLLLIEDEVIEYVDVRDNSFIVWQDLHSPQLTGRGMEGTTKVEHLNGTLVEQRILDHTYIVGQRPLAEINNILLDKEYTPVDPPSLVDPTSAPPVIQFDKKPRYIRYSNSTTLEEKNVDTVDPITGTAVYSPHLAFDDEPDTHAVMSEETAAGVLGLTLSTPLENLGEILSAYVEIEHWPSYFYEKDYVRVSVNGVVGTKILSRPSGADILDIIKEWNVSHTHDHAIDDSHTHDPYSTKAISDAQAHDHELYGGPVTVYSGEILPISEGSRLILNNSYMLPTMGRLLLFKISNPPAGGIFRHLDIKIELRLIDGDINVKCGGVSSMVSDTSHFSDQMKAYTINLYSIKTLSEPMVFDCYERAFLPDGEHGFFILDEITITAVYDVEPAVEPRDINVETQVADIYTPKKDGLFQVSDVKYKDIPIIKLDLSKENPGRSFIDKIDVTDLVNTRPWEWFKDRLITLQYFNVNAEESPYIMITNVKWVIEYRKEETVYTTDVYCEPVALDNNRPDKVIQHLLESVGLPESRMGNIVKNVPSWDDTEIWWDISGKNSYGSWIDGGSVVDVVDTPFDLAAARYDSLVYKIDGLIAATDSVRDAIKNICKQTRSRLIWTAGKACLTVMEPVNKWITQKRITKDELQLKAISFERQETADTINKLNINYAKDNSDTDEFIKTYQEKDVKSIAALSERAEEWDFELVRNDDMAASLALFYVNQRKFPSTFYVITTYLPNFDVEKTDVIVVASPFQKLNLKKCVVRSVKRAFGSGKNKSINTIELLVESINWKLYKYPLADKVDITDGLVLANLLTDNPQLNDILSFISESYFDEEIPAKDLFIQKWIYRIFPDITEHTVIPSDSIEISTLITLEDGVALNDYDLIVYDAKGFGLMPFGLVGFGGVVPKPERKFDGVSALDTIQIIFN